MPFSITSTQDRQILKLEGTVGIRHAQDLAAMLGGGLKEGMPVEVETGGLEDIDTCILQILCSLRRTVLELAFDRPSEVFIGALDRCGLRRELLTDREGS